VTNVVPNVLGLDQAMFYLENKIDTDFTKIDAVLDYGVGRFKVNMHLA
jgi:hypothetical protein